MFDAQIRSAPCVARFAVVRGVGELTKVETFFPIQ